MIVCWFGSFMTLVGTSQIAPIMPIFIKQLGVHNMALIEQLSGIAFGATFVICAIFSPIWGHASDKYGRKPMLLRASLGMTIVVFCVGMAQNVYELIALRMLQGVISGYSTACTTLIATQIDKDHAGWALGVLGTSTVAGSLFGPLLGGCFSEILGVRSIFFVTSGLMFIVFIATYFLVKEDFKAPEKKIPKMRDVWRTIPHADLIIVMFITSFILQLALYSIEPIITVYVSQLTKNSAHIALISGIAFSASGVANILVASKLGKLSDKIGSEKVILISLVFSSIIFIPQAFVKDAAQLTFLRLLLGFATAGLTPSINGMVKKLTPDSLVGRVFGFNMAAMYLGTFAGSVIGGQIASHLGIQYIFFFTSILLIINAVWVYEKVYKRIHADNNRHKGIFERNFGFGHSGIFR